MTPDNQDTHNQDTPTGAGAHGVPREQCAGCGATLVEDQRYCLQCGARRGNPRLDFTAFWTALSPTGERSGGREAQSARVERDAAHAHNAQTSSGGSQSSGRWGEWGALGGWGTPGSAPSRGVVGVLAACVLAVGILAGAALGPSPSGSPAAAATLAQRAIAALVAQASASPPASAPANPTTTSASEPAPTAKAPSEPGQAASKASSTQASSESSSSGEGSSGSQPSERSSSEASSKSSGKGEKTAPGTPIKLPAVKHVWVIALSGTSFSAALASSTVDPYLAKQLVPKGTLLSDTRSARTARLRTGSRCCPGRA